MKCKIAIDKRRMRKDGRYPIIVEGCNVGKIRVNTPYLAEESNWSDDKFFLKGHKRENAMLSRFRCEIENMISELQFNGTRVPDSKFREMIYGIVNPLENTKREAKPFVHYLDEFSSRKTNAGTKSVYLTTRNKIVEYDASCTLETMDLTWLRKFEAWMAKTMKINAYSIHLRNIRAVFNYCIDEEYTTLYPFRRFKIKKEETRKRSLTVEQLRTLRDYPCEDYQRKYRDIFMLMFYLIGINGTDLFNARRSQIVNGRLEYKRAKTGKLYSVLVQPEAMEIIDRYKGKDYLIDVMDTYSNYKDFLHRMGIALKSIGEVRRVGRGGRKERTPLFPSISSYWSRHTWATIAAELDIPIDTISEALGHEYGCATTHIYVNFNQRKVDEANRRVIDYVNKDKA